MTAGILLLEDELLSGKKQDFAQNSVLRNWVKNRTLHKIQCSGIGNINFLDLKEAEFLTLNTVVGPEWRI